MKIIYRISAIVLIVSLFLSGCALGTVEKLYCLPKRSEEYENLQAVIDKAMVGLQYCAPASGDNRLFLQTADLDGDGYDEYLVFAKDDSDKPLKILIFCRLASGYVLMDTTEGYGFAYDFVTYAQMDDKPGVEVIVGRQVSDQIVRAVSVYRFTSGIARQLLSTAYSQMCTSDLNGDGTSELFLLSPGTSEKSYGTARLYTYYDGELHRTPEITLSASESGFRQLISGKLSDGESVLYVTCASTNQTLVTDIFCMDNRQLAVCGSDITTESLHNYYVYPYDMDDDGVLELPRLVKLDRLEENVPQEYMIEWYSLDSHGNSAAEYWTYHNFADNWYLQLEQNSYQHMAVIRTERKTEFYMNGSLSFAILVLTDADREEQAQLPGRIVLYSGESAIYVAEMDENAAELGIKEELLRRFQLIRMDINTERN